MIQRLSWCSLLVAALCVSMIGFTLRVAGSESVSPPLNKASTAQIGEPILHQGEVSQRAAIHLSEAIQFGKRGEYTLTPGYYVRTSEGVGWEYYAPAEGPNAGSVLKAPGAITVQGSFHFSNDGKTIGMITNFYQAMNAEAKGITRTTRPLLSSDKVQRTLVYGGKMGSRIKLAYRETWKNITRPSDERFVEYDLADSKVIEIKGALIEVIEADEESIRYRVTRAFKN